ncbi:MAG: hypothetical protein AAGA34_12620 [Pseudomonadota bacterium]
MTDLTKTIAKGTLGTVAVGAMALASATPALADTYHHKDNGIGAEEVIAGALVIGGIAALAGAFDGKRDRNHRYAYNTGHHHGGYANISPRRAINRCVRAAENQARRFGGWRFADVTQVRDVDRTRGGFRVKGRIEVQGNRNFRRNFDRGRFTCYFNGQGRPLIDFDSVRGLR